MKTFLNKMLGPDWLTRGIRIWGGLTVVLVAYVLCVVFWFPIASSQYQRVRECAGIIGPVLTASSLAWAWFFQVKHKENVDTAPNRSLSIQLPTSIRERLESLALTEGVSVDYFIVSILSSRAARGSDEQLTALLAKAPDVPPMPRDELD